MVYVYLIDRVQTINHQCEHIANISNFGRGYFFPFINCAHHAIHFLNHQPPIPNVVNHKKKPTRIFIFIYIEPTELMAKMCAIKLLVIFLLQCMVKYMTNKHTLHHVLHGFQKKNYY